MATENILMSAVKNGADRQEIHEKLRQLSQKVGEQIKLEGKNNNLLELIAEDPTIPLTQEQLQEAINPKHFIGLAPEQVEEFLKTIFPE
jgi:adenylosuccinate lyase